MVETPELHVVDAIAFVGADAGRCTAETVHPSGCIARGPLHVLVAEGYVGPIGDVRVVAITDDQLEGIQLIGLAVVVANIRPIDE